MRAQTDLQVLEAASTFVLPGPKVWVVGDWHGNSGWVQTLLPALRRIDPSVSTLLHVGDFWMQPDLVDHWASMAGIERVLVTLGNHEPYNLYTPLLEAHPGCAVRISWTVWLLPRPFAFTAGGRRLVSLGGAASVDRLLRHESVDWWADERILNRHVDAALRMSADVMVTHESPAMTPVPAVQRILETNPRQFPWEVLAESARSRVQVKRVWDALRPDLLLHGHIHTYDEGVASDGRRVVSLGRDTFEGNVVSLETTSLEVANVPLRRLRGE